MAIKFVDKGPEDEPDRKRRPAAAATSPSPLPDPAPVSDEASYALPHAKPEPKARGRKAPPTPVATEPTTAQAPLDGLLPPLPLAKPEPKPRGRKKAFG